MHKYLIFWILFLPVMLQAQIGFIMPAGQKQYEIPFEYTNNFIILSLTINEKIPLKFIFDTGAEHTVLSQREITDILNVRYEREFRITGSDMSTELVAYLVRRIRFSINNKLNAPSEDILVLQEDYFRFEEYAGINVHGILAAAVFSKFVIKINYDKKIITLYDRESFKFREPGYSELPVEVNRNKLYLTTAIQIVPDSTFNAKLLIDTGAGLPLLLFSDSHPLVRPPANAIPTNIGMGLGGYLAGYTGRVFEVMLGKFSQQSVVTYFQAIDSSERKEYANKRQGLLGNGIMSHFNLLLDYQGARVFVKPTRNYRKAYVFDRSGLTLIASGQNLNTFTIQNVLQNSPAADAGLQKGDIITRIGISPAGFFSLGDVQRLLQKKPGKKIKLTIQRGPETIRKTIVLRELL